MLKFTRLLDRKRPAVLTTFTCALCGIVLLLAVFSSHSWLTVELSSMLLLVREEVGLFSVNQFTLVGGGGTREKAKAVQMSLSDLQRTFCAYSGDDYVDQNGVVPDFTKFIPGGSDSSESEMDTSASTCVVIEAVRTVGLLTAAASLCACIIYVLAVLDLYRSVEIVEMLEPHMLPSEEAAVEAQFQKNNGGYVRMDLASIPTVIAFRSLETVQGSTAELLSQQGRDKLSSCRFRTKACLSLLGFVIGIWLLLLVLASVERDRLARTLGGVTFSGAADLPLVVSLSSAFYVVMLLTFLTWLSYRWQKSFPQHDFSTLYLAAPCGAFF